MTLVWALGERIIDSGPQNEAYVIKTMTEIKKWSLPDPWVSESSGKSVPRKSKTFTVAHMFTICMCQHVHVYTKPYKAILKHRHTGHGNTVDDCKWTSIPKWCNVEDLNFCRQYLVFLAWTLIQILVATSGGHRSTCGEMGRPLDMSCSHRIGNIDPRPIPHAWASQLPPSTL